MQEEISKTIVIHILDSVMPAGHKKDEKYMKMRDTTVLQEQALTNMGMERFNIIENLFFCPIVQLMVDHDYTKEEVMDYISKLLDAFVEKRHDINSLQERLKEKQKELDAIYEEYGFKRH